MFHRENEVLRQGTGIAVEGATVTVYVNGTDTAGDYSAATKAPIYPANVVAAQIAGSVVTTDEFGHYAYYVPSGVYDEVLTYGSITKVDSYIQMFDMAGFTSDAETFAEAAEASAEAAAASATSALASKNDAAASATAAANSATDAAASSTTAGTARDAAVTAELASEASANASETSRSAAAVSETNAATSATAAAASAASIASLGPLHIVGSTDCSANPNYPAAGKGDAYLVSVAGKIGGAAGVSVGVGDLYVATAANAGGTQAGVGASWDTLIHASVSAGGGLLAANNLSDVANAVAAKDNISKQSANIASAATTDLSTATGDLVTITGTTTITSLGTCAAGVERTVKFAGALTLTYNATSLILPTAANITTVAGDTAVFRSLGSGNWLCIGYQTASGAALVGAALASAADVQVGTNTAKAVTPSALAGSAAPQTLTDAATISWDMSLGFNAKVTLGGSRTLATPTNPVLGQTYSLGVGQDGTGTRLLTWPASFDWGTTGAPTLTTAINKVDRITLFCTDAATPKFEAFLSAKGFAS